MTKQIYQSPWNWGKPYIISGLGFLRIDIVWKRLFFQWFILKHIKKGFFFDKDLMSSACGYKWVCRLCVFFMVDQLRDEESKQI